MKRPVTPDQYIIGEGCQGCSSKFLSAGSDHSCFLSLNVFACREDHDAGISLWGKFRADPVLRTWAMCFSPTAESFGVSAQIGSGVVRGGPEVKFHKGSTTRVPQGFCEGRGGAGIKRAPHAVGDITRSPHYGLRAGLPILNYYPLLVC